MHRGRNTESMTARTSVRFGHARKPDSSAVPVSTTAGSGNLSKRKPCSIAHIRSLSPFHRPDMSETVQKGRKMASHPSSNLVFYCKDENLVHFQMKQLGHFFIFASLLKRGHFQRNHFFFISVFDYFHEENCHQWKQREISEVLSLCENFDKL